MGDFQIGRLQAALANATNEVTVAAAKINFDFCLVKYEAPKEYQPLGGLLSKRRKQDAESGASHVTARRLAALFQDVCPETPNLIRAYGQRVSEISKKATEKEPSSFADSIFASYVGVDATSIWAAATSSPTGKGNALQVHLLASMLAKMWPAPEAVSIWYELVQDRRRVIAQKLEEGDSLPFSLAAAAAQQEIPREKLSEWDASARAWLETADATMRYKQTQLRLVLENVEMSIDRQVGLYSSVVEAWVKALTVMERLVSGVPQEVHDGAALLGLAAWHIYPDMHVFGNRNIEVAMKDELVAPGGVVTLGCSASATTPETGVSWSLSLAHLKFYGQPVKSNGSMHAGPTLLSFDELMLATLGCILRLWDMTHVHVPLLQRVISAITVNIARERGTDPGHVEYLPGLQLLEEACHGYVRNPEDTSAYVNLGINRPKFVTERNTIGGQHITRQMFGYLHDAIFLSMMRDDEARVQFLRRIALRTLNSQSVEAHNCVIKYSSTDPRLIPAWTSVFPQEGSRLGCMRHCRWNTTNPPTEVIGHGGKVTFQEDGLFIMKIEGKESTQLAPWFGDKYAKIYLKQDPTKPAISLPNIEMEDLLWALEHDLLVLDLEEDVILTTLRLLANVHKMVFRHLSERIIDIRILSLPLIDAAWTDGSFNKEFPGKSLSAPESATAISLLSYFVAGFNLKTHLIPRNVCGVSTGNSIYVPTKLVSDPFETCEKGALVRILGNIGRPGLAWLTPVDEPIVDDSNNESWKVINRNIFDGKPENAFSNTSMHLSFTNWEPAESLSVGLRDAQFVVMESAVSIREAGRWIGDVDILAAFSDPRVRSLRPQATCQHKRDEPLDMAMVSVESWDELRNSHSGNVVVRAHGNWVARLAIVAFLSQQADRGSFLLENIIVCPKDVCWKCVEKSPACVYIY